MTALVYTIGHSNRELTDFLALLAQHDITAVADVRSQPYSRVSPHFSIKPLANSLEQNRIAYVFLGRQLGARTIDATCYVGGRIQYDMLARTEGFQDGLGRIERGVKKHRIALMCAEREPLACHRSILIARHLLYRGVQVKHIIDKNVIEDHEKSLLRLLSTLHMDDIRMFPQDEVIELAYERQGARIAFERSGAEETKRRESA